MSDERASILCFLDPISPYAFLALERIASDSRLSGLNWTIRPVVYAKLLEAHGLVGPVESEAKRRYTMLDVVRCAESLGLTVEGPPAHPFRSLAALRVLSLFTESTRALELAGTMFRAAWTDGRDLEDWETLESLVRSVGEDSTNLKDRATTPENKARLIESTKRATERGVFGVPTFEFQSELFWGHDRIDALLDRIAGETRAPNPATIDKLIARPIGVRR